MALPSLFLLTSILYHMGQCAYVNMGIVNGTVVKANSRPYMVSVQKDGAHHCGGFLVSENFVMTAAHCWEKGENLTVVVGTHTLRKNDPALPVQLYHVNPTFDSANLLNDIMLLQLNTSVKMSKNIQRIQLPNKKQSKVKAKQVCSIAGWGKPSENDKRSNHLMEVKVTVMDIKACKEQVEEPFPVDRLVCTKGHGGFCQGDSGGPLVCGNTAVGIVSFFISEDCKTSKNPYVYTKIYTFLPWINVILGLKD